MGLKRATLLLLMLGSVTITGCSLSRQSEIRLYPIEKSDIFLIPKDAIITIKQGTVAKNLEGKVVAEWKKDTEILIEKDGYFLSSFWLREVGRVKAGE